MRDPVISLFHHAAGTSVSIVQEESSVDFWEKHDNHDRNNDDEQIEDIPLPPLFAAAPDLLAACQAALDYFNETRSGREWRDNCGQEPGLLRYAINKAVAQV